MRASASFRCSRGVIAAVCPKPNSYLVKTDDGRSFRRNRSSIYVDKSTPVVPRAVGKPSHKNGSHWREMLDIPRRQVLVPRVPVGRVVTFEPFQQELRQAAQRDPTLTPTVNSCQTLSRAFEANWPAAEVIMQYETRGKVYSIPN